MQHRDFPQEQQHVDETVALIRGEHRFAQELEAQYAKEAEKQRQRLVGSYSNDWYLAEKLHALTKQKLNNLTHALEKPYFSRIDFTDDKGRQNRYYIGKWGVSQADRQVVVDWRAPIANLYYSGQVGPAAYTAPKGTISGEITLKRIYQIEQAQLKRIIDADIVTQDEYLQDVLSDHADARLKDIVTTIQAEQNDIIRHSHRRALLVQGVAGAGKTTVALHRITWLLYTYQKTMAPENLMIIAPTPLFLNYISSVLPELGAENVLQTTFYGLAKLLCGITLPPLNDCNALLFFLREQDAEKRARTARIYRKKGALSFKALMDAYVRYREEHILPDHALMLGKSVVVSREELLRLFCEELAPYAIEERFGRFQKMLENRVKAAQTALENKLELEVARRANLAKAQYKEDDPRRSDYLRDLYALRDQKLAKLKESTKTLVADYLNKIRHPGLLELYRDFYIADFPLPSVISRDDWADVCVHSLSILNQDYLETSDLAALIYLCGKLIGFKSQLDIHHTVLDEAQDFSPLQFDILKSLTRNAAFTIVGDLAQGIHSYWGVTDWKKMLSEVFGENRADYLTLEVSYRSTVEIMNFAGQVAKRYPFPDQATAKPVLRHGPQPVIRKGGIREIMETVQALKANGMKTIAIVHRLPEQCEELYQALDPQLDHLHLYSDTDEQYSGGIMVIPAHLVKGLEFDAVIVADVSEEVFADTELDCRLLYVCLTRPLHQLICFYQGKLTPLLAE